MKLEIQTFKGKDRPIEGQEDEFSLYENIKTKVYECDTMDQDMKVSVKNTSLYQVVLDDVILTTQEDVNNIMEFLKNAKRSFEV